MSGLSHPFPSPWSLSLSLSSSSSLLSADAPRNENQLLSAMERQAEEQRKQIAKMYDHIKPMGKTAQVRKAKNGRLRGG